MITKKEAIEMYFSDSPKKIGEKFVERMIKTMSNDSLISNFNRKSKGSRLIQVDKYHFDLEFFELNERAILRLNTSEENLHYHNDKNMSRQEMRYRLFHNLDC
jgi:hypothetical protein